MEDRFKPARFRESDPTKADITNPLPLKYDSGSYVRNLCLVWPDGNRKFYNYAYLISGEFLAGENVIRLIFSSETVILEGSYLLQLFAELLEHVPKEINCTEDRYAALAEADTPFITKISLEANA